MKTSMTVRYQPGATLFLAGSGIVILLIFFLLWIFPKQQYLKQLDGDIITVKTQLELQEKLRPLYMRLAAQNKAGMMERLTVPPQASLPKLQIDSIVPALSNIAKKSKLEIVSVNPDLSVLQANPASLLVNANLQGNFTNFRDFLIELGKIPYLETVGKVDIQQAGMIKKYKIELWYSVK